MFKTTNDAKKHLIGHAVNKLLELNLITLEQREITRGDVITDLCGETSYIRWGSAGHYELLIEVCWKRKEEIERVTRYITFKRFTNDNCSMSYYINCGAWLERKTGKFLQIPNHRTSFINDHVEHGYGSELRSIPECNPNGFNLMGRVM